MTTPRLTLTLLLATALLPACDKNAVQDIAGPASGASIKFFNFAPGAPGVNFFANDTKVTAILSTLCPLESTDPRCTTTGIESTTGVTYGGAANGASGWYSDVTPGQYTLSGRIAATTDYGLAIANLPATIAAGKAYSYYLSGIYNTTTKSADSFIIEDQLPAVDHNVAYVRFVHAISNANPMTLYVTNRTTLAETAVGGQLTYKAGGAFIALPPGSYDLATRYANTTTSAITRVNVGFGAGRIYTITARGNISTASTILLDNTANR